MTVIVHPDIAVTVCNVHADSVDAGTGVAAGYFVIYSGTVPALATDALSGNDALISMEMANPGFGAAVDVPVSKYAEAVAEVIAEKPADMSGTATFYRQFDRDGVVRWQGTVSEPNLDGDMWISNINVVAAVGVIVNSYVFRQPYA